MSKAVVLLSGGMDSTTVLAHAQYLEHQILALSFNYGQRHSHELISAAAIADYFNVTHTVVDLSGSRIFDGSDSSLVNPAVKVPEGHYADESMKGTVVPNRNMMMLSIAAAFAISNGAEQIFYGAHAGDHAIYPDCRPQFVKAMQKALELCDWKQIKLEVPFLHKTKTDIVLRGTSLHVPWDMTYSCYKGKKGIHCGVCGTCTERREAFFDAQVTDPTVYENT
jgi:7-cyano-7-deazaguanine synthase